LDNEEQQQISRIRQNCCELRVRMTEQMKRLYSFSNPSADDFNQNGSAILY